MSDSIDDLPSDPAAVAWLESVLRAPRAGRPALLATPLVRFARIVEKPLPTPGWYDAAHAILLDGSLAVLRMTFDVDGAWKGWRCNACRGTVVPPAGTLGRIMIIDNAAATEPPPVPPSSGHRP